MDDEQSGTWMSYAELGKIRGISKESSLKLALRRGWRRQADNKGIVRVCVPLEFAVQRDIGADARADKNLGAVDISMDAKRLANEMGNALTILREQMSTAQAANSRMAEDIVALRAQVVILAAERETARQEREIARIEAASGKAEVRVLREALTSARLPLWRRLLGEG